MDEQFKPDQEPAVRAGFKIYAALVAFSCLGTLFSHYSHVNPGVIRPVAAILTLLAATLTLIRILGGRQEAIVAAIGDHDADGARQAMLNHLIFAEQRSYEYLKNV